MRRQDSTCECRNKKSLSIIYTPYIFNIKPCVIRHVWILRSRRRHRSPEKTDLVKGQFVHPKPMSLLLLSVYIYVSTIFVRGRPSVHPLSPLSRLSLDCGRHRENIHRKGGPGIEPTTFWMSRYAQTNLKRTMNYTEVTCGRCRSVIGQ